MSDELERRGGGRTTDHDKVMGKVAQRHAELDTAEVKLHEDLLVEVYVGADRRLHRDPQDHMVAIAAVLVGPEDTPISPELTSLVLKALKLGGSLQQFLEAFKAAGGTVEQALNLLMAVFGTEEVGAVLSSRFSRPTTIRATASKNYRVVGHPRFTEARENSERHRTLTDQRYTLGTYRGEEALIAPDYDTSSSSEAPRRDRDGSPRAPRPGTEVREYRPRDDSGRNSGSRDRGDRPVRRDDRSRDDGAPTGAYPELGRLAAGAPASEEPSGPSTADLPVARDGDAAPARESGSRAGGWMSVFEGRPGR